ncbi:MAG: hypothetical protein K2H44_04465 [Muribaculaceae bacterium]|nr:hypothetical protein [Muribaculaceae bacterium]MDE5844620.1 hypothetical protein [Muribaculaceae bacterium]
MQLNSTIADAAAKLSAEAAGVSAEAAKVAAENKISALKDAAAEKLQQAKAVAAEQAANAGDVINNLKQQGVEQLGGVQDKLKDFAGTALEKGAQLADKIAAAAHNAADKMNK